MFTHSAPLEQFEIIPIISIIALPTFYLAITNSTIFILIILSLFCTLLNIIKPNIKIIPTRWQSLIEEIYLFCKDLVETSIGVQGTKFFPFIFFLFSFLLISNLIGLIPYSFTITSHVFITFGLSLTLFLGINIIAIKKHKLHFFGFFIPNGTPMALIPMFFIIEFASYLARVFSLAIRLFANMVSGHTLLKIIAGFAWTMLSLGGVWTILHIFPLLLVIAVTGLELGIASLQAYVFTILVCLYLNDAIHLAH